ncbi:carboxymuconolactone decarboxylase family protein [Gelidibacter sp. F63206]|uniref:carboxymuconolactone decarboxylase family protein n=1 Tax=Gelidibacter sp. F63206 TaxID=2926425 RepID=UPI001FF268F5|nr:carboxymuconolactone decarboxylase family protein [Gelidibacter sp. F63206]MCK0114910.1 carboxymuconolactone decarboxylase family protein [Gelidibacter sp. F63206]
MTNFNIPTREEVSSNNQEIFDNLEKAVGFVPNLYATIAYSDTALESYLQFQNAKTSLSKKEKEVINLIVSQVNGCNYCLSAHTTIGKMNGFTDEQILELRQGYFSTNEKFDALVKVAKAITINKGKVDDATLENYFNAGYSKGTLVDVILAVGDKVIMNYLHNLTQIDIDFPVAQELETVQA